MAITSYTYPTVMSVDGTSQTYVGSKSFVKQDGGYYDFNGMTGEILNFTEHPRIDQHTRPLIIHLADYANGTSLILEYFAETRQDHTTYVDYTTKLVDTRTGADLPNGDKIRTSYSDYVIIPEGRGTLESKKAMWIPTMTQYPSGAGGITTVGTEATFMSMFGTIWLCYDATTAGYIDEQLVGVKKNTDLKNIVNLVIGNSLLYNDSDLQNATNDMVNIGNGINPFPDPFNPSSDPFKNDTSRPGGGKGSYSSKGDTTGKPGLPSSGVLSSGFIAMYTPTLAQLQQLGGVLWSDDFMDNILKLWNDPMEAIITLGLVPFTPTSSGSTSCQIGNYDTEVSMARVTGQYMTLSCGSVTIDEFWGNALDYGPYTEAELYLPFVGMRQIDIDDVMNKTVSIDYNIDLLGGETIAYVTVDNRVLYDFRCNIMTSVPISSSSYASLYSGILRAVSGAAIGAAAGGGVGAAAGALTSAVNVMTAKHSTVERGSESSPNAGVLGILTPYIILHRPVQSLPVDFGHFKGYPSNLTKTLGSVSGYTEVEYIHLDGINATEEEKEEIYALLKAGVIL